MFHNKMLNANIIFLITFFLYAQCIQGNDYKTRIIGHPAQIFSSFLAIPINGFDQVKFRNSIFTPFSPP